jgi:hypothetical protein
MPRTDNKPTARPASSKLHQVTVLESSVFFDPLSVYECPVPAPVVANHERSIVIQKSGVFC